MRATSVRPRQRRDLPAAVAGHDHVVRQQGLEPGQIPMPGGGEKPLRELLALLARGLKPGAALRDVMPAPARELAHVVFALADDLCDLRIAVIEHVVQEQRGSLLGRQALEQYQHRQRQRFGHLGVLGRILSAVGEDRLGQPLADVLFTPRSSLIASRVVTVATYAARR